MKPSGNSRITDVRVGVHTSIAGGISKAVERAASLDCRTLQIFSHNPRQWQKSIISPQEAKRFRYLRQKYDVTPVFIHVSYLINLASLSDDILGKSVDLLSYELDNADALDAEYIVLHTGSAGEQDGHAARTGAAKALLRAVAACQHGASILLENTAGEKGDITSSVTALAEIIDMCKSDRIAGICIDTCHAFSSGYDITSGDGVANLFGEINTYIGLDKLKLIHLNDSKRPLGSGVDRHEHIGKGFIGTRGFRNLLSDKRIRNVPIILETPKKDEDDDRRNLKKVFGILKNHGRTNNPRS